MVLTDHPGSLESLIQPLFLKAQVESFPGEVQGTGWIDLAVAPHQIVVCIGQHILLFICGQGNSIYCPRCDDRLQGVQLMVPMVVVLPLCHSVGKEHKYEDYG